MIRCVIMTIGSYCISFHARYLITSVACLRGPRASPMHCKHKFHEVTFIIGDALKVVQVGTNRKPACEFLSVVIV